MRKKRNIIIAATAFFLLIGIALMYLFTVVFPKEREKEQLLKAMQEYYDAKIAAYESENEKYEDYEA